MTKPESPGLVRYQFMRVHEDHEGTPYWRDVHSHRRLRGVDQLVGHRAGRPGAALVWPSEPPAWRGWLALRELVR